MLFFSITMTAAVLSLTPLGSDATKVRYSAAGREPKESSRQQKAINQLDGPLIEVAVVGLRGRGGEGRRPPQKRERGRPQNRPVNERLFFLLFLLPLSSPALNQTPRQKIRERKTSIFKTLLERGKRRGEERRGRSERRRGLRCGPLCPKRRKRKREREIVGKERQYCMKATFSNFDSCFAHVRACVTLLFNSFPLSAETDTPLADYSTRQPKKKGKLVRWKTEWWSDTFFSFFLSRPFPLFLSCPCSTFDPLVFPPSFPSHLSFFPCSLSCYCYSPSSFPFRWLLSSPPKLLPQFISP